MDLIIFILMDCPIHIVTVSMGLPFLYFKGLPVSKSLRFISVFEVRFILENSATLWSSLFVKVPVYQYRG